MKSEGPGTARVGWWFVAAGGLVVIRAVIELANPSYWSPVSFLDYSAVVGTSVAWLITSWAISLLARHPRLRRASLALMVAAAGTAISAAGNLIEDLLDVPLGGDLFSWGGIVGAIGLLLGSILVLTVTDPVRWSGIFLAAFIAGGVFPDDGGQFLGGVALLGLGMWFLVGDPDTRQSVDTPST